MNTLIAVEPSALPVEEFDFLIIGSGVAGLSCAIELAPHGRVAVLTKEDIADGSTQWAQGGIAAVLSPEPLDSPQLHEQDTMQAGAGLCDRSAVEVLVSEGPQRIRELIARGAHFDTEPSGELKLTREAAHRARRIVHSFGDSTGREVQRSLSHSALEHAGITVYEHTLTIDLVLDQSTLEGVTTQRCIGAVALDTDSGELTLFRGAATILATGGIGALYKVTTNPPVLTGDGMAMAYRAGAELMDMEFVQFHPTSFAKGPNNPKFLISEAVRGEGAVLLNQHGERFMSKYHPDAELAPRDVVSRAIAQEILNSGQEFVTLDLTANTAQQIAARFPKIYATCVAYGIDPAQEPIPVSPAEHYMMGGIRTNLDGATNVPGLLACGECACTGVHGANRLASNSMLEGLVFGIRTVRAAIEEKSCAAQWQIAQETRREALASPEVTLEPRTLSHESDVAAAREKLKETMWQYVGLVRNGQGLKRALKVLNELYAQWGEPAPIREEIELANMIETAWLITRAALQREESRGAHYRTDFPDLRDDWRFHLVLHGSRENLQIEHVTPR
ncbi:MAG: L-aspartate oxidase [Abditibacteriota bacterium]|nr:L-aspartate oxidase [Abditibacteriota bacterium]